MKRNKIKYLSVALETFSLVCYLEVCCSIFKYLGILSCLSDSDLYFKFRSKSRHCVIYGPGLAALVGPDVDGSLSAAGQGVYGQRLGRRSGCSSPSCFLNFLLSPFTLNKNGKSNAVSIL